MPSYEGDIVAWANEQARLLRTGRLDLLDIEHIAEEIEDVGKSEQRELASRMAALLAHLIKWQFQLQRRGRSWQRTIREQRNSVARRLRRTPSLAASLTDPDWWADAWGDAVALASSKTGLDTLPDASSGDSLLISHPSSGDSLLISPSSGDSLLISPIATATELTKLSPESIGNCGLSLRYSSTQSGRYRRPRTTAHPGTRP
jgi:hypothetical protein